MLNGYKNILLKPVCWFTLAGHLKARQDKLDVPALAKFNSYKNLGQLFVLKYLTIND